MARMLYVSIVAMVISCLGVRYAQSWQATMLRVCMELTYSEN